MLKAPDESIKDETVVGGRFPQLLCQLRRNFTRFARKVAPPNPNPNPKVCPHPYTITVIVFEDMFNILRGDTHVQLVNKVWDIYNFEVRLRLGKSRNYNAVIVSLKRVFNIFFNFLEVGI